MYLVPPTKHVHSTHVLCTLYYVLCTCTYTLYTVMLVLLRVCIQVQVVHPDRDIDLYHWSSERFSSAWINTISVLLAKGRARVSVADAATDWPKRIRDMQYLDHESIVAGA